MKRFLLFVLCSPLLFALGLEGRSLVMSEFNNRALRETPVPEPVQLDKRLADDLAEMQKLALQPGRHLPEHKPAAELDKLQKEAGGYALALAAAHDSQLALADWSGQNIEAKLEEPYKGLWKQVMQAETKFHRLKKEMLPAGEVKPAFLVEMDEHLKQVQDKAYSERSKEIREFLDKTRAVLALADKNGFRPDVLKKVDDLAAGNPELAVLAKEAAAKAWQEVLPKELDYEPRYWLGNSNGEGAEYRIYQRREEGADNQPFIVMEFKGKDEFTYLTFSKEYPKSPPRDKKAELARLVSLQFEFAKISEIRGVTLEKPYKLRPLEKNVLAHAYNQTRPQGDDKAGPIEFQKNLWQKYQELAKKNDLLEEKLKKANDMDGAFVIQQLQIHYGEQTARLRGLLGTARTCKVLFTESSK